MPLALITDRSTLEWADLAILAVALFLYCLLAIPFPGLVLRPFFWIVTRTIYRIHVTGRENVPATGPALLLSNHVTFIDWLLVWRATPRKLRFVAFAGWTKNPIFRWFLSVTDSILINGEGGPKQIVKSLKQITAALDRGEAICLFPEGALSRGSGVMLPFRRGFEKVLRDAKQPVPVIPMYLSQLWGSIFSYSQGKVLWKWPQRIPYRVTVAFGKPLPSDDHGAGGATGDSGTLRRRDDPRERPLAAGASTILAGCGPLFQHAQSCLDRCLGRPAA